MPEVERERSAMRMHRLFVRAAYSFGIVFAWLAIFTTSYLFYGSVGEALVYTALIYIVGQIFVFFATPLFARLLRHGTARLMLYGTFAGGAAFLMLALVLSAPETAFAPFMGGALAFSIFLSVHRALYRVPYGVGLIRAFGEERPVTGFAAEVFISVLPALAGILFLAGGAPIVFFAALLCMLLAAPPALNMRAEYASFDWSLGRTYRSLFSSEHRDLVVRSLAHGIESSALHFLWPIAIALIVGLRFDIFGAVISLTLLFVFLLHRYASGWWSALTLDRSAPVRAAVVFSAWIFRLTAAGPFAVVAVDAFHRLAPGERRESDGFTAHDDASHIDELSVLKELADSGGKVLAALFALILLQQFGVAVALAAPMVLAALVAALIALRDTTPRVLPSSAA